ncbi:MAG: hypothetical protein JETT_2390 [Candidatus Jettenia ecosi]|uniref:Uncharacterized protein n=1 Tax=Candidatus Jettenia ecosi TaxID=2494326 RepID=A0A533QL90_9BACT|nr:MAG: hypothetical protein JETT_2390 [Candidatus Jettenia ecosi]
MRGHGLPVPPGLELSKNLTVSIWNHLKTERGFRTEIGFGIASIVISKQNVTE